VRLSHRVLVVVGRWGWATIAMGCTPTSLQQRRSNAVVVADSPIGTPSDAPSLVTAEKLPCSSRRKAARFADAFPLPNRRRGAVYVEHDRHGHEAAQCASLATAAATHSRFEPLGVTSQCTRSGAQRRFGPALTLTTAIMLLRASPRRSHAWFQATMQALSAQDRGPVESPTSMRDSAVPSPCPRLPRLGTPKDRVT
jgi:hypothetical protein